MPRRPQREPNMPCVFFLVCLLAAGSYAQTPPTASKTAAQKHPHSGCAAALSAASRLAAAREKRAHGTVHARLSPQEQSVLFVHQVAASGEEEALHGGTPRAHRLTALARMLFRLRRWL